MNLRVSDVSARVERPSSAWAGLERCRHPWFSDARYQHPPTSTPPTTTTRPPTTAPGGGCEPGYSPCLPITDDLNCDDIDDSLKPIHVTGDDPYGLDSDDDGYGCET